MDSLFYLLGWQTFLYLPAFSPLHWQSLLQGVLALSQSRRSFNYKCQPRRHKQQQAPSRHATKISSPSLGKARDNETLSDIWAWPKVIWGQKGPVMALHKLQSHITPTEIHVYVEIVRYMQGRSLLYPSEHFMSSLLKHFLTCSWHKGCWGLICRGHLAPILLCDVVNHYRSGQTCCQLSSS